MASFIKAIKALCPRLELTRAASSERYLEMVTSRTTLSRGVVKNVQESELETLAFLLLEGRPVHTGVAIYTPSINLKGELEVNVRVDKRLLGAVRKRGRSKVGSITPRTSARARTSWWLCGMRGIPKTR